MDRSYNFGFFLSRFSNQNTTDQGTSVEIELWNAYSQNFSLEVINPVEKIRLN